MLARDHRVQTRLRIVIAITAALMLPATILAATAAADLHLVYQSTDGGRSWSRSDQGLPGNARVNAFGSSGDSLFAGTDAGIFVSQDRARTWRAASGPASSSGRIVAFTSLGDKTFAGASSSKLLESTDHGATWTLNETFPPQNPRCLLADQGRLYAGTDAAGVFVSADNGRSWTQIQEGLPPHAQVFALAALKGRIFAGLYSKGLFLWDDKARRWRKKGSVLPLVLASADDTLVVGHNPGGIHTSDDLGATWSKATPTIFGNFTSLEPDQPSEIWADAPVWELASGRGVVIAGADSAIYYSENNGRAWTRARNGLPQHSPGVAFLVQPDFVLAATTTRIRAATESERPAQ